MSSWIVEFLGRHFETITQYVKHDQELLAACCSVLEESGNWISFGIASSDGDGTTLLWVTIDIEVINEGEVNVRFGRGGLRGDPDRFFLQARPSDWQAFFTREEELVRPYQSYWGMLRVLGPQSDDQVKVRCYAENNGFGKYARIWRIVLDRIRDVVSTQISPTTARTRSRAEVELPEEEVEDDCVTGWYIWIQHSEYGKVKIFFETSGDGDQPILFLHTAGSDSRQYHSLMNNKILRQKCKMFAFDLPAHGRSTLGTKQFPDAYALTEESYLESIALVIQKANLNPNNNLILCGASMAGHVCLAAAIRARKLGIRGVIPCEGCAHLPLSQPIYEVKGADSSLLDPERVCGMIAPSSDEYYKRQIWWQYSSHGNGVFAGDLKFYFKGWDGRGRLHKIDTDFCPVYMLTGEYDYSCTADASRETAAMIHGAVFEEMKALGHFPLTENPKAVLPYLLKAIEHIQRHRQDIQ